MLTWSTTNDTAHRRITMLIWGQPGVGKTSLIKTLPVQNDNEILVIAADPGQLALRDRAFPLVQAQAFTDFADIYNYLAMPQAKATHRFVVLDGIDDVAQLCLNDVAKRTKDGRQIYGEMADQMRHFIFALRDLSDYSVIFITHDSLDKDEMSRMYYGPAFPGNQVRQAMPGFFDEVLAMRIFTDDQGKSLRALQTQPDVDPRYICKDRSGALAPIEAPDLGVIFNKIHPTT